MKIFFKLAVAFVLVIMLGACIAQNEMNFANRDGAAQLALMDNETPLPAPDEKMASDFEMSAEVKTWMNRDGTWALKDVIYTEPVNVTFINGNPGITQLGLVRFLDKQDDGSYADYELMNLRWSEKVRFVKLDPGHYAVTQYREMPGQGIMQKIKGFKEFDVTNEPFVVEFTEKKMPLPNNVM